MFTIVCDNNRVFVHAKGASELILASCTRYIVENGQALSLDEGKKEEIRMSVINEYASK